MEFITTYGLYRQRTTNQFQCTTRQYGIYDVWPFGDDILRFISMAFMACVGVYAMWPQYMFANFSSRAKSESESRDRDRGWVENIFYHNFVGYASVEK